MAVITRTSTRTESTDPKGSNTRSWRTRSNFVCIAVDTLSLDYGASKDFAVHYGWLPTNRWGIECMAGLGELPAAGATLIVGAPKVKGATGGPARIFALV